MRKMLKKENGITLVALVITIIILLILAGITISQLTGSALFENARLAEQKSKEAQQKENGILDEYQSLIDGGYRNQSYDSNIYDVWLTWLSLAGIENPESYNEQNILENETIVNKLMSNKNAIDYMLKSKYFIMPAVANSPKAMTALGNVEQEIKNEILETMAKSEYRKNFSEYLVYDADTLLGTAGGRGYYKKNNGWALSGAYHRNGALFMLVGKSTESVIGYCTYSPSVLSVATSFEYEGETWYYGIVEYGFNDGTGVSSVTNGKNIGTVISHEAAARYILDDFFGKIE